MTTDDGRTGRFEDLAAAAAAARAGALVGAEPARRRGKAPSCRILNAGGFVLRMAGVLLVVAGFWPFIWTVFEVITLVRGGSSEWSIRIGDGSFSARMQGWPAIIYGMIWSIGVWCGATVVFALGHGLYVLRDVAWAARAGREA